MDARRRKGGKKKEESARAIFPAKKVVGDCLARHYTWSSPCLKSEISMYTWNTNTVSDDEKEKENGRKHAQDRRSNILITRGMLLSSTYSHTVVHQYILLIIDAWRARRWTAAHHKSKLTNMGSSCGTCTKHNKEKIYPLASQYLVILLWLPHARRMMEDGGDCRSSDGYYYDTRHDDHDDWAASIYYFFFFFFFLTFVISLFGVIQGACCSPQLFFIEKSF